MSNKKKIVNLGKERLYLKKTCNKRRATIAIGKILTKWSVSISNGRYMAFLLQGGINKSRKNWVWGHGISRRNNDAVKQEMFFWRSADSLEGTMKWSGLHIQCLLKFKGGPKFRDLWKKERSLARVWLCQVSRYLSTCHGDKQFSWPFMRQRVGNWRACGWSWYR